MSLTREMLFEAGITEKSVVDKLMKAYGSAIENAKTQARSELEAENNTLKEQLKLQSDKIEELQKDNNLNSQVKETLDNLQKEFDQYKSDSETKLAQVNKTNAIALALKDVKAYDSDVLRK